MPLTDKQIKLYKPEPRTKKIYDERGLYLEVSPNGGKWWRLKYRFNKKEKRISLGIYPDISLKEARERRDSARKLLANGIDPSQYKKQQKEASELKNLNMFENIAKEWIIASNSTWSTGYLKLTTSRLEKNVFPWIGNVPITDITQSALLKVIRRIEDRGAHETAKKVLRLCGQVFRYAVASDRCDRDITSDLKGALIQSKPTHFASITEPKEVGALLRMIDGYSGSYIVKAAMQFLSLVFVRTGELRHAKWSDIDMKIAEWRYMITKTNTPHIVPLSKQAITILKELKPYTGTSEYVFPSARSNKRPMSDNAILAALRRMGISKDEMTGHGFRAMARTILDEVLKIRPDYIEHQLAHAVRDPNGRAYNRTAYLPERKQMMQQWADYLDHLKIESTN